MIGPRASTTRSNKVLSWISDTIRNRGFFGALSYYFRATFELLRDLTPERRRSRYGDIDYDVDYGVDTTWATVPMRIRLRELVSGAQYQASEPGLFHKILRALPVSANGLTFIDLGSGKGRTLMMASNYPFRRIIGLELLDELHQVAQTNIARYRSDQQKCFNIESFCGDARDFEFPDDPIVLYLFNPFPDFVLTVVLENLRKSLARMPREAYVIYHNLVHEHIFQAQTWLQELHRTHQFAIYRAESDTARLLGAPSCAVC